MGCVSPTYDVLEMADRDALTDAGVMVWEVRAFPGAFLRDERVAHLDIGIVRQFPDAAAAWIETVRSEAFPE